MEEMNEKLEEKIEEMKLKLYQILFTKESQSNAELQESRNFSELIMNDVSNSSLQLASEEQRKTDENVLRLVEEQKMEKEVALKKILDLERDLYAKQKLEMEIAELEGNLEVMKHLGNDEAVQNKMKEMNEQLEEKIEEMSGLEQLYQALVTKERQSNDELQEARKELIMGWGELLSSSRVHIGIKRMGEIDKKIFDTACKQKFPEDSESDVKAAVACSQWQEKLKNSDWYPFKVIMVSEGTHEKLLDENDEDLQALKSEWGYEVYVGVTDALKDLDEYNASGRYPVPELWNFKENRKATLKEVISFIFKLLKNVKRRR